MTIVNADDFGMSPTVNEAIRLAFKKGFLTQTTIMTNMPQFEEAIAISKADGFFDKVGLHINLDEGEPLTAQMKANPHFVRNGRFIKGNFAKQIRKFYISSYDAECVYHEVEAQMLCYINAGFPLMHLDSHHHVHINWSVMRIVKKLGVKYGFKSARVAALMATDSWFKLRYKRAINKYIKTAFKSSPDLFYPYQDAPSFPSDKIVELMTHPEMVDGVPVDMLSRPRNLYVKI
jgi:hypothetical protein